MLVTRTQSSRLAAKLMSAKRLQPPREQFGSLTDAGCKEMVRLITAAWERSG